VRHIRHGRYERHHSPVASVYSIMIQMLEDVIKDAQKLPKMIHGLCALPLLLAPELRGVVSTVAYPTFQAYGCAVARPVL
jgi:hypothetical protein